MTLSDGDKAICMEIAREITKEVLVEHISSCPHGKSFIKSKLLIVGCVVGVSLGGGIGGAGIMMAFAKMFAGI